MNKVTTLLLILLFATGAASASESKSVDKNAFELPLKAARTISFITDEGTWMSVDVSPDGRTLIFDLLGDLYLLPIGGGIARQITHGMAIDAYPKFSPDGTKVAFVSDRNGFWNVWIAGSDGNDPVQVTYQRKRTFGAPIWTADGAGLIVSAFSYEGSAIEMYALRNRDPVIVDDRGKVVGFRPGLTRNADGTALLYSLSDDQSYEGHQIERFDMLTKCVQRITAAPGGAFRPVLSHSGRYLIYATQSLNGRISLRLLDFLSGQERWLIQEAHRDVIEASEPSGLGLTELMPTAALLPDDSALITSFGGKIWRIALKDGQASIVPFQAHVAQQLGPLARFQYSITDETVQVKRLRFARLSPDGRWLAFNALGSLWKSRLGSSEVVRLTPRAMDAIEPAWSPDGQYIAFTTWDEFSGGEIYRMRSGGGKPERLTNEAAFYRDLSYSPQGDHLLFRTASRSTGMVDYSRLVEHDWGFLDRALEQLSIATLPSSGGFARRLLTQEPHPGVDINRFEIGGPYFEGSGKRIFFSAVNMSPGGEPFGGIYWIGLDGGLLREEIKVGWRLDNPPGDFVVSPKGDRALLISPYVRQLHLVKLSENRMEVPDLSTFVNRASDFPVQKAQDSPVAISLGGAEYAAWAADGESFHFMQGNKFYQYGVSDFERQGASYKPKIFSIRLRVPAARPEGSIVLRGVRAITMRDREVLERADIVVRNNRIVAIGPMGQVHIPEGSHELSMSGKTILPGWVDIHAHFYYDYLMRKENPKLLAALAYGVTTTRNPSLSREFVDSYHAEEVDAGFRMGPRIFYSGSPGWFSPEGVRNLDDARAGLRHYAADWGAQGFKQYQHRSRMMRQWLVIAAVENELTPTNERDGFFNNLSMILDGYGGIEHRLGVTPLYNDVIQLLVRSGTTWTPTLIVNGQHEFLARYDLAKAAKLRRFSPVPWNQVRGVQEIRRGTRDDILSDSADTAKIVAAGGRVGLGSHGDVVGIGVHWDLQSIAGGGMPPHDVLRVGTILSAEAIGHERNLGSLEVGKLADLQILDENPLDDINNIGSIRYIMKNGFLYEADTLNQVWPNRKALARQWWQGN